MLACAQVGQVTAWRRTAARADAALRPWRLAGAMLLLLLLSVAGLLALG